MCAMVLWVLCEANPWDLVLPRHLLGLQRSNLGCQLCPQAPLPRDEVVGRRGRGDERKDTRKLEVG